MTPLNRVTVASRVFGFAAILGLGVVSRDPQVIFSLLVIATVVTAAVYVSLTTPLATAFVVAVEAVVTGLVIGLALPGGIMFLPYLLALTLIAGISRGVVGVSAVVAVQCLTILVVAVNWAPDAGHEGLLRVLSPWLLTSIGVGLLGAWFRGAGVVPGPSDRDASYEVARRLLTQLRAVAKRLSSGLDPVTIATHIRDEVVEAVATIQIGVFVRTDGGVLSPLIYSDDAAREELHQYTTSTLADGCWTEMEPVVSAADTSGHSYVTALPLRVGSRMIGVVLARLSAVPTRDSLKALMRQLDELSLRLDTALAFDEIRSIATVEERRRLAREIHDGIAQEVASLGYVVDHLLAGVGSDEQERGLTSLRQELTRIVSELRLSIFDLRSDELRETGLGSALSEYVHQVGSRSSMTVHLRLDEGPTRLRAETEAELLRIAQEAITNARKHSDAKNLWVDCQVQPPFAQLEVRDDGRGLSQGRSDSYGLRIMKERAQRLDAQLEVHGATDLPEGPGTLVRVTIGRPPSAVPQAEGVLADDATEA